MTKKQKTISSSDFKARCGQMIDEVSSGKGPVVITRRGKPVAKLVRIDGGDRKTSFGFAKGCIKIRGDIMAPIDVEWEAER